MKLTSTEKAARIAGWALSVTLLAGTIASTLAADIATGKGGATLLMKPQRPVTTAVQPAMSCPTCKDEYVTRKDLGARGALKPTMIVERHLCKGCDTKLTVAGTGKARQTVAMHQCTSGAVKDLACCEGH